MSETTPATTPLSPPLWLLLALAALSSSLSLPSYPPPPPSASTFDSLLEDEQDTAARERRTRARAAAAEAALRKEGKAWVAALCKVIDIDVHQLPDEIEESRVRASVEEAKDGWTEGERERLAGVLVEAGLAASKAQNEAQAKGTSDGGAPAKSDSSSSTSMFSFGSSDKDKEKKKAEEEAAAAQLRYTPLHRTLAHRTLTLLTLSPAHYLPQAEARLGATLFSALKSASDAQTQAVETTRAKHAEGWGGSLGRKLATGAGVIAGGVLLGVTGGLAAPAIAAVLAPLGVGSILTAGAAPVVLGTLFGVGGGGLAGRRVRERWRGVEEFGFTEVGKGTRISKEEAEELRGAKERYKARVRKPRTASGSEVAGAPGSAGAGVADVNAAAAGQEGGKEKSTEDQVEASRQSLEERLLTLSLSTTSAAPSGTANPAPPSPSDKDKSAAALNLDSPRASLDAGRPSLNAPAEEAEIKDSPHPPSLTATIVVPGLLTVSQTEAVSAWRAICSGQQVWSATLGEVAAQKERMDSQSRVQQEKQATGTSEEKTAAPGEGQEEPDATASTTEAEVEAQAEAPIELSAATTSKLKQTLSLSDGRDVYLLRFEPALMLKTGREIDHWVTSKLKGKIKAEIIKRTVLNAYFAAVSLPLTVYGVASMSLDNSWMQAQDRANKAGRILGEVLEQRVQGERPVVLIGSSIGALTILKALLYLASRPSPSGEGGGAPPISTYVESAYLISLPAAPTSAEWAACRSVVSRRLVNAYSGADWVLAGVVRLHEVISRAATLNSGISPAGLAPVEQRGVEDVDVGEVVRGHMEVNAKMGDILRIIDVDA